MSEPRMLDWQDADVQNCPWCRHNDLHSIWRIDRTDNMPEYWICGECGNKASLDQIAEANGYEAGAIDVEGSEQ